MNSRQLLIGRLIPALVFAVVVAGLASACSGEAEEGPAAAGLQAASPTIPFETPPAWDCVGTPPPGWMTPPGAVGSGCVLLPTPVPCTQLTVAGREVCLPNALVRSFCCTGLAPGSPTTTTTTIRFDGSFVTWQTFSDKGASRDELVEWSVLPEHEDEFADLRAAFEAAGQPIP